tara:strand:- start:130 stop:762 length:633 start_codon:yes stop_codon:yes gene_type:complete
MIVGLDEAGYGALMGDFVAGAVVIPENVEIPGLNDSKKLSAKKRQLLYDEILKKAYYGIGIIRCEEIESLTMGVCRKLVFHRALDDMFQKNPDLNVSHMIVDGVVFQQYKNISFECRPKADATVTCVGAASIIAKHYRDSCILDICRQYPTMAQAYDWSSNMGYPTIKHREALKNVGVSKYHRLSYGPCRIAYYENDQKLTDFTESDTNY